MQISIILSFFFVFVCFCNAFTIKLSNGIAVDTKKRKSLLNSEGNSKNFQIDNHYQLKYLKYGFKASKTEQYFIQLTEGARHEELSKILGHDAESVMENNLGIWTASLSQLQELDPKLIQWVGLYKPHYKFSAINPSNKKKPFDNLGRPKKTDVFSFRIVLNHGVNPNLSFEKRNSLSKEFKQWNEMHGYGLKYDTRLSAFQGSNVMTLEIFPKDDPNKLILSNVYDEVLRFFAEKPEIQYIERKLRASLFNKEAATILQSNVRTITGNQNDLVYRNGIKGNDQIVCVTDSGLDTGNCMFYDTNKPSFTFNTVISGHRKLVGYWNVSGSDLYDDAGGHGTHVCGSVAGSLTNTDPQTYVDYHGLAPNAKLALIDVGKVGGEGLYIPDDLNVGLFPIGYNAGARIFTNSWGYSAAGSFSCNYDCSCDQTNSYCVTNYGRDCCRVGNKYSTSSQTADRFLYNHPDSIVLFAAGNEGDIAAKGTVSDPCVSKNVLCVGAAQVTNKGFQDSVDFADFSEAIAYFKSMGYPINTEADCCAYSGSGYTTIRSNCCSSYMKSGYASSSTNYNNKNMAYFSSRGPAYDEAIAPAVQRIKPDVSAPGSKIVSAHGNGKNPHSYHCATTRPNGGNDATLLQMEGTSMATPALAGAVALVREYFTTNLKKYSYAPTTDVAPSGVLLKALIIHAAQPMAGLVLLDGTTTRSQALPQTFPNIYNGFGLPDLSYIMPFSNEQTLGNQPVVDMKYENKKNFLNTQTTPLTYSFKLYDKLETSGKFNQFFKATLVWYDYESDPNNMNTASILQCDLDLTVAIPSKSKTYFGNGISSGDRVNTVETVLISQTELNSLALTSNDEIIVSVKKGASGRFTRTSVPFALVVSSTYSFTSQADTITCFGTLASDTAKVCSGHGTCSSTNNCTCNANYLGKDCNVTSCNGILSNSTAVCSGKGSCNSPNTCTCFAGYLSASYCSTWNCNGKLNNAAGVCSGHGVCSKPETCTCSTGYTGNDCQTISCFGVPSTNSSVCSGRGTCMAPDTCSCSANFSGKDCSVTKCNGIFSNSTSVCNGKGKCTSYDICTCDAGYISSSFCSTWNCNGKLNTDGNVCSAHGICAKPENCNCTSGYSGNDCQYVSCNGIISSDPKVCSAHGSCASPNNCQCNSDYYGKDCSVTTCFGVYSNSSTVCNSHGSCTAPDTCTCFAGYLKATNCKDYGCYELAPNDPTVCSAHGKCTGPNSCVCNSPYIHEKCQNWACYGIPTNSSSVCWGHGNCAVNTATNSTVCQCSSGYVGIDCFTPVCFNILGNSTEVCQGRGSCVAPNQCSCKKGWKGPDCNVVSAAFGIKNSMSTNFVILLVTAFISMFFMH